MLISLSLHLLNSKDNAFKKIGINKSGRGSNFLSIIRRVKVTATEGGSVSKKFAEYEIACQMSFSADTLFEKDILLKWSVWKRFSEFKLFDKVDTAPVHHMMSYQ